MKVVIDGNASEVVIDEVEDLNGLSVVLVAVSAERAAELIGDLGRIEDDHAWLSIETLKAVAPAPRSQGWDERFAKTMAYAARSGWVDPAGTFVRAHIEPATAQI